MRHLKFAFIGVHSRSFFEMWRRQNAAHGVFFCLFTGEGVLLTAADIFFTPADLFFTRYSPASSPSRMAACGNAGLSPKRRLKSCAMRRASNGAPGILKNSAMASNC